MPAFDDKQSLTNVFKVIYDLWGEAVHLLILCKNANTYTDVRPLYGKRPYWGGVRDVIKNHFIYIFNINVIGLYELHIHVCLLSYLKNHNFFIKHLVLLSFQISLVAPPLLAVSFWVLKKSEFRFPALITRSFCIHPSPHTPLLYQGLI